MFCPKGYNCLRCDRTNSKGGGTVVIYKANLNISEVNLNFLSIGVSYELLCFDLYFDKSCVRFISVYFPPCQNEAITLELCTVLTQLLVFDKPVFILGDFNFPKIDWQTYSSSGSSSHRAFVNFCSFNSLNQLIDYPTHEKGNILDLILCNDSAKTLIMNHSSSSSSWYTDHYLISLTLSLNQHSSFSNTHSYPDFKSCNFDIFSDIFLKTNWNFCTSLDNNVQHNYDSFILYLKNLIDLHVPLKYSNHKPKRKPKGIKRLLSQKKILFRKMKSDSSFKSAYKLACKNYDQAINLWHDKIESDLCFNPTSKKFYKYVNSKMKYSHAIPPLVDQSNNVILSDIDKANLFNSAFHSFFTSNNSSLPCSTSSNPTNKMLPFQISPFDILKAGRSLKGKLSRTPDGIPSFFLLNLLDPLLKPLTFLFNLSLNSHKAPVQWKSALVIPIFKKGDRRNPGNYRPVSLTSSMSRLFEKVLLNKMLEYVQINNLLSPLQFGFLPKRSSCEQLLSCSYKWLQSYCQNESVKVLYTDITKAFDSISHKIIVNTLQEYGFSEQAVLWLQDFLYDRQQRVCIRNSSSSPLSVVSGVPQGSVIGPFLFIISINAISKCLSSNHVSLYMFADDTKVFSTSLPELQTTTNSVCDWLSAHSLRLAPHKCLLLKIKKSHLSDVDQVFIDNNLVQEKSYVKDLGILVSSNMKWNVHIDYITHTASVKSFLILKSFRSRNIWTYIHTFNTYIRPILEYNSPVWNPHLQSQINKLEKIQRHFTKRAFEKCNIPFSSYQDRLKKVNLLSLIDRRKFNDMVLLFKLINRCLSTNFCSFFQFKSNQYSLRSHNLQISPNKFFKLSQWTGSFFNRAPQVWNSLPEKIVYSKSLAQFKALLKLHLLRSN